MTKQGHHVLEKINPRGGGSSRNVLMCSSTKALVTNIGVCEYKKGLSTSSFILIHFEAAIFIFLIF